MDININHLKYFFDTIKLGSVNKAALANFVSQPAISQGIRKLENQLGVPLLDHKRNTIVPTPESLYLLGNMEKIFLAIDELKERTQELKSEVSGVIRVGISSSIAKSIVIPKLRGFEKKYPLIELKLKIGKTQNQIFELESGEIDLGMTIDNGELMRFKKQILLRGQFVIVGKESSPKRILTTQNRPEVIELKKNFPKNEGPISSIEIESWDLLYEMARNGLGSAFIPDFVQLPKDKLQDLTDHFKAPRINYDVVYFYKEEKALKQTMNAFLNEIKIESFDFD